MELYIYGIVAGVALITTTFAFYHAYANQRERNRNVERRLRRPF